MSDLATIVHEGEIVVDEPAGFVRVLALTNPFTLDRVDRRVPEGQTLGAIIRDLGLPDWKGALVSIDGSPVPRQWWDCVRPRAGHLVVVRAIPRGGGGDGGNKGWIQIIAGVLLIIIGIVLTIFGFGSGVPLIVMGIGMVVSGAITLIFPPPTLPKLKSGSATDQPVFSITGSRNTANPYGPIPRVYGRHRIFPCFGALPFTEIVGNVQYLRQLFVLGYGPLELSEFKIGETPLDQFQEVEIEVRQGFPFDLPLTLFPGDVFEEPLSILLSRDFTTKPPTEPEPVRVTHGEVDEWSVDFVFGSGLFHINGDGQVVGTTAHILIWYRKLGDTEWILASDGIYSGATVQPLRKSFRQVVAERATYEVKMKQTLPGGTLGGTGLGSVTSGATWAVLRSVLYEDPVTLTGLCEVALRIKATDQLNGVVDQFNCIAESILPDYNAATNAWELRKTSNPASVFRDILQGPANARPVGDHRLDLASLEAWHTECAARGRTFSFVVEQFTTVSELLRQVAAVGRATLGSVDGTFGVVRDVLQTVPVQHFTPRNSREFRGTKLFRDMPHAIKARFINPETGWDIDERLVYDDGFDVSNATKFEAIQFFGVTSAEQAHKEARYHFAAARLRPEAYDFVTDVEHLVCTRGDLIRITHDVPLFGIGYGRLKSVTLAAGNLTAVTIDEPMTMEIGTQYSLRVRRADGTSLVMAITAVEGPQTTLTLVTPLPINQAPDFIQAPAAGDLFQFGTIGQESVEAIVTRVEMLKDMGARITCVDAAPAIHDADTGPIPPHDPQITVPPELRHPPEPLVYALSSNGTLVSRAPGTSIGSTVLVQWVFPSAENLEGAKVQTAWRPSGQADTEPWTRVPEEVQAEANMIAAAPLSPGSTVDVRLRTVSRFGVPSAWVHIVEIELPNPPVAVTYTLEAITDGYLARIGTRLGPPPPPRVTGLRLVNSISGSPNDTAFAGTDAKFAWNATSLFRGLGDGEDDQTQDTEIRDYVVEIHTGGVRRHATTTTFPGFVYRYEQNIEDHTGAPSRTLLIKVWARGQDGQLSPFSAELTVTNPAPDMSQIMPLLLATVEAIVVDWKAYATTDHDLDHFQVLVGTGSPPSTVVATRSRSQREAIIPGLASGQQVFVRVVPYDAFGAGVPSQIASVTPLSLATIDFFTRSFSPQGIALSADPVASVVAWTAGDLTYTVDGTTIETRAIAAGSAAWSSGVVFVYYILGETIFRTTTTAAIALGTDRAVMALYRGGTDLIVNWGKALVHGGDILANTIGANQLITSSAVITGAAQIANAIIGNAHIADLSASKITAGDILVQILIAAGKIATAASGARVEMRSDGLEILNSSGESVFRGQSSTPFIRIGRTIAAGATVPPLELSSLGDLQAIVTAQIQNLALIRFAEIEHNENRATAVGSSLSETVVESFTDVIGTVRTTDKIGTWWRVTVTIATDGAFASNVTGVVRVRRGTDTSGVIIAQATRTLTTAAKGGAAASGTITVSSWDIQDPALANTLHDYVMTIQITGAAGIITTVTGTIDILLLAKSA